MMKLTWAAILPLDTDGICDAVSPQGEAILRALAAGTPLREIGARHGISRERTRQLATRALSRIVCSAAAIDALPAVSRPEARVKLALKATRRRMLRNMRSRHIDYDPEVMPDLIAWLKAEAVRQGERCITLA